MRRISAHVLIALAAIGLAASVAAAATPTAQPPRAVLHDFVCQKALDPAARAFSVTAVMRPLTGTQKLAVNFFLLQKTAATAGYVTVPGTGLGVWISPTNPVTLGQRPGDIWNVPHPVADLDAPAAYRFRVEFRWIGLHGKVLGTATRYSRVCFEPELRPDLTVDSVSVQPDASHPKLDDDYLATIGNTGATGASNVVVQLSDSGIVHDRTIDHVGPHATKTVTFVGPVCSPADQPTVTVDPNDQVDVSSRTDATMTVTCPAPQTATTPTTTTTTTTTTTGA
jgi:hypothetical protein